MKILSLIALILIPCVPVRSQEFAIKRIEITENSVILHYDLIDTVKSRTYTINVFSSRDNFLAPLVKISGDVGLGVKPGMNKKVTWSSRDELGPTFHGEVELEVRGRVYIPFVRFDSFQENQVFKRGKAKTLTWTGGTRQNILNFEIHRGDKFVDVIPNIANSGSYALTLPRNLKPGKGYYLVVSDSKNKDQVMKTPTFTVKRKVPLLLKAAPVVIAGVVLTLVDFKKGEDEVDGPPETPIRNK